MVSTGCKQKKGKKVERGKLSAKRGIVKKSDCKAVSATRRSQRLSVKVQAIQKDVKKPASGKRNTKKRTVQGKSRNLKVDIAPKAKSNKKVTPVIIKPKDEVSKTKQKRRKLQQEDVKVVAAAKSVAPEGRKRRHKNDLLVPREDIPISSSNAYFTGKEAPPFVSVRSFRRILHRCIFRKDLNELVKCIRNKKQLCKDAFNWSYSFSSKVSVEERAILTEDVKFISEVVRLHTDFDEKESMSNDRARLEDVLLTEAGTGRKNFHMLGRATANIEMTRGGKEGNNAFVKYESRYCAGLGLDVQLLLENDVSFGTLDFLTSLKRPPYTSLRDTYSSNIYVAVRFGNRKLAAKLIETYAKYNFNELHIQTLKNTTQPLKKFMPISVLKKAYRNKDITPLHTAAINPNASYLKAIMAVEANFNVADQDSWYTIHYAAVCEGPGPLKLILDKGIQYSLLNKAKELPIHCASRAGRVHNVKLLLEAEEKTYLAMQSEEEDPDNLRSVVEADSEEDSAPATKKAKPGMIKRGPVTINAKTKDGYTPLHLAVEKNHADVVELLLSNENINVEAQLSASGQKITPLMMACQNGFLNIANILIDKGGAIVEKVDKLKRTALTHAVINGQGHVVSMLLRRGASPTFPDSSGNTPAHYAAAYGWIECLELLAKADPKALGTCNDWQLTPLAVAYMKGHLGIVEWLIDGPFSTYVDINCRDSSGNTLIFSLINHYRILSTKNLYSQIEYLLGKGAKCSFKDLYLNTPLHCFAELMVKLQVEGDDSDVEDAEDNARRLTLSEYKHCIDMLIENGANLDDRNQNGESAVFSALKGYNLVAVEYLLDKYLEDGRNLCDLETRTDSGEFSENLLHMLLELPFKVYNDYTVWDTSYTPSYNQYDIVPVLKVMIAADKNLCEKWLLERNKRGMTPFLVFCEQFTKIQPKFGSVRDVEKKKKCSRYLEQLLGRICEVVPLLVSIFPSVILQEYKEKEENKDNLKESTTGGFNIGENRSKGISAIFYAIRGNSVCEETVYRFVLDCKEYLIKNKLLTMFIDSACDAGILQELLSQRNENGYTPLLCAVGSSDVSTSLYLMERAATCNVHEIHGAMVPTQYDMEKKLYIPLNKTVLMYAVENKLFEVIKNLKLTVEQWNATSENGDTALHYAARDVSSSTVTCFQLLKEKGVLNKANNKLQYPLHIAVEAVQQMGADVLTEPVEWLIANASSLHEPDVDGRLPLHYAFVHSGDLTLNGSCTIDPICIVSVLNNGMDKAKIDYADKLGNTPLHYAALRGANVCTVTLLRYGCNPDCVNNEGNTPLAVSVQHAKEACTLTLIQARSNVANKVYIHLSSSTDDERDKWTWIPNRRSKRESIDVTTISSLVVRNGWEGIIYVILDVIGKSVEYLGELVKAALEHRKYNLVQILLRMLTSAINNAAEEVQKRNREFAESLNLFLVFVQHLPSTSLSEAAKKVFYQLCALEIKWWSSNKEGYKPRSPVIEELAKCGNYELMDMIYLYDSENEKMWSQIEYSCDETNPLSGIIERCTQKQISEVSKDAKKWIELFGKQFGINTLMSYKRPYFFGIAPWRYRKPVPEHYRTTALIKAVQSRCIPLVKFLLESEILSTDINASDEYGLTPLMHACIVNSEECLRLLFDPSCRDTDSSGQENKMTKTNGILRKRKPDVESGVGLLFGGKRTRCAGSCEAASDDEEVGNADSESGLDEEHGLECSSGGKRRLRSGCMEGQEEKKNGGKSVPIHPIKLRSSLDIAKTVLLNNSTIFLGMNVSGEMNFLHFMVLPCGWENTDLLIALCKGTPEIAKMINDSSNCSVTPLIEAKARNQMKMVQTMARLSKMGKIQTEFPAVDESVPGTRYNISEDSEACLAKFALKNRQEMSKNPARTHLKPHKNSGYEDRGEICVVKTNGAEDSLYKVLLTKTDLQYGNCGFHNYYRMELIKCKGVELYVLFTNWGRIGDATGQYQRTPFSSFAEASKEFCSIFRAKTGNEFSEISNFVEKQNKYRLLKVDNSKPDNIAELELELSSSKKIHADSSDDLVYSLVKDISNVKRLQERTRMLGTCNRLQVPFGRLSRKDILAAHDILVQLKDVMDELDKVRKNAGPVEEILALLRKQAAMSNEFYKLMPLGGFESLSLPIIDNEEVIKGYEKTIEDLLEFELAGKLVTAAYEKMPLDALECEIKLLDSEDLMTQHILQYIQNSSTSRVLRMFSVKSKQSNEQFNSNSLDIENHMYLWHGTKPENLLSILKLGLVATPSSALQTGQMFGQGIYFADVFAKSESYCTESDNEVKYILLCQVALGKMGCINSVYEYRAKQDKSDLYDTIKIRGENAPDPLYNMTLEDGIVIPLGKVGRHNAREQNYFGYSSGLSYNEYVVPDKTHVTVRYLVAFR